MKILWCAQDTSEKCWNQNFTYEERAWARHHDVTFYGQNRGPLGGFEPATIRVANAAKWVEADLVVVGEHNLAGNLGTFEGLRTPVAALMTDQHEKDLPERARRWADWNVEIVLYRYEGGIADVRGWFKEHSELKHLRFVYSPWAIDPSVFFPDCHSAKPFDVALVGKREPEIYPERDLAHNTLLADSDISFLTAPHPSCFHPGFGAKKQGAHIGRAYAELLRSAKIAVASGGNAGRLVAKYFEIPACGALLLAQVGVPGMEEAGFEVGKNFMPLEASRADLQVRSILASDFWKEVAQNGMALMMERHTWDHRVQEVTKRLHGAMPL